MESTQIIIALSQQNLKLMEEVAFLKAELAKHQIEIVPVSKGKRQNLKKVIVSEENCVPVKPKHPSHIETGRKLVLFNKTKKDNLTEFIENAKLNW